MVSLIYMPMFTSVAIVLGIILDFILGDPHNWWHPIIFIGKLIARLERAFRGKTNTEGKQAEAKTKQVTQHALAKRERMQGTALWVIVVCISMLIPAALLAGAWLLHPIIYTVFAAIMCYQIMATKSLRDESKKVQQALEQEGLPAARKQVGMIVGRDTDSLTEEGVIRAAVETVAENTSDGSIAPLFYMLLGGPVLAFGYKAVNTMDSMLGYKNEKYINFGRTAAKMDDVANFLPSRLSALLMVLATGFCGLNRRNAWNIFLRDRKKSPSPNSAQTESVCAGALGVSLLGDTSYFGEIHHKETIGDSLREVEAEDIRRANQLLYGTVILGSFILIPIRMIVILLLYMQFVL